MRLFAIVVLFIALLVALYAPTPATRDAAGDDTAANAADTERGEGAVEATEQLAASRDAALSPVGDGLSGITLTRDADSHFYLDMLVNGRSMRFLVDTGASSVALGRSDARRLGLTVFPDDFTGTAETANGRARFAPVRIDSMRAGPLDAADVDAVVIDVENGMPLLGQSFLRRLDEVTVRGDVMTLR